MNAVSQLIATTNRPRRQAREPRFCAECRHHVATRVMLFVPDHLCGHPTVCHPVTREPQLRCDDMRREKGTCGHRAKLYERATQAPGAGKPLTTARIAELFGRHIEAAR